MGRIWWILWAGQLSLLPQDLNRLIFKVLKFIRLSSATLTMVQSNDRIILKHPLL